MNKVIMRVLGMSCSHCENRVKAALFELDGIKKVKANAKKDEVVCTYDESKLSLEQLYGAVEQAGYEVKR